jgi:hypothetical protein
MPDKKPRTPAQIEASRRNGARSRGPKSAAGRQQAALNSLKHGLTARINFVLNHEDQELFDQLLDGYNRAYMPANEPEAQLVLEAARCAWRLHRITNVEASLLNLEVEDQREHVAEKFIRISDDDRIALAFSRLSALTNGLQVVSRYEATCRRGLHTATTALNRIQAERRRSETRPLQVPDTEELRNEPGDGVKIVPIPEQTEDFVDPAAARVPFGFPKPQAPEVGS